MNVEAIIGKQITDTRTIGGEIPADVKYYDVLDVNLYQLTAGGDEWGSITLLVDHNGYYGGWMYQPTELEGWYPQAHHVKITKNGDFPKPVQE